MTNEEIIEMHHLERTISNSNFMTAAGVLRTAAYYCDKGEWSEAKPYARLAYLRLLFLEIPTEDKVKIRDGVAVRNQTLWYRDEDIGPRQVTLDFDDATLNPHLYSLEKPKVREVIKYIYED